MIFEQRGGGVAAAASSAGGVDGQQTTRHCGASGSGETLVSPFAAVALAPASARDDEPKACGGVVEKRQGSWLLTSSVRRQSAAAVPGGSAPRRPSFSIVAAAAGSQVCRSRLWRICTSAEASSVYDAGNTPMRCSLRSPSNGPVHACASKLFGVKLD